MKNNININVNAFCCLPFFRTVQQLFHLFLKLCFQLHFEAVVQVFLMSKPYFLGLYLAVCNLVSVIDQTEVAFKQFYPVRGFVDVSCVLIWKYIPVQELYPSYLFFPPGLFRSYQSTQDVWKLIRALHGSLDVQDFLSYCIHNQSTCSGEQPKWKCSLRPAVRMAGSVCLHGHPLQYSWLENPMDRGAGGLHRVTKSRT